MLEKSNFEKFLSDEGFQVTTMERGDSFGDFFIIYTSPFFNLKYSRSRSFDSVDISSLIDVDNWYDLAIVLEFLEGGNDVNLPQSFSEQELYFRKNIDQIKKVFSQKEYQHTKRSLDKLQELRVQKMFSKWL